MNHYPRMGEHVPAATGDEQERRHAGRNAGTDCPDRAADGLHHVIEGEACSKNGMRRISGQDIYRVCADCGTVLDEQHLDY